MDSTEIYTEIQEREGREAAAIDRESREEIDYCRSTPNDRRRYGERQCDIMDWLLCGDEPSREITSREIFNGADDYDVEVDDESEID